ncbi:MAG: ATP-dependent DNA helicase RecG [Candidatus Omnitrophica bacterium]|nr:ATP-dependent DNA helicase RecG [Candidatus Omnitrophota bacterium]
MISNTSVQYIKGVGPAKKKLFNKLGIEHIEDLLYFFPRRYEDRRTITPISKVQSGEWQTITGRVLNLGARRSYYTKKHVTEVTFDDGTGRIRCVWFNQPYLNKYFKTGKRFILYGKIDTYKNYLQMISPEYEELQADDQEHLHSNRIVPIYPLTRGMGQRYIRKVTKTCLDKYIDEVHDHLPVPIRNKYHLYNIRRSLLFIHYPESFDDQSEALRRISFEEFFFYQISILLRRQFIVQKKGMAHQLKDAQVLGFIHSFPFILTAAQIKVIREIRQDMREPKPMLRLLQGDVGSGKTIVAVFGCFNSYMNGHQSCIMAPTEILARQHYHNLTQMIGCGGPLTGMRVALLVSSIKRKERDAVYKQIESGDIHVVIGTHAVINEEIEFNDLSFAVIDEQHKFGVRQRAMLGEKGTNPDILIMTATPIPRTLCITLYGDLDVSIIDQLPAGRGQIHTQLYSDGQNQEVYQLVKEQLQQGRQAYFVYPLVEESERLDLKAAEDMYQHFKSKVFQSYRVGLVHGQMKSQDTQSVMRDYKEGKIDMLVATTVLEVGIDVPNATVMVIEHAERFGLAQLHQLRGRIGRGIHDGYCLLIGDPNNAEGTKRLQAIVSTTNGFEIARQDLLIRGPGCFFGRHQHGLSELRVANPATQLDVLETARKEAKQLIEDDPTLSQQDHQDINHVIHQRYPTFLANIQAG